MLRNRILALVTSHIHTTHFIRHPVFPLVRPNPTHRFSRNYVKVCGPIFMDKRGDKCQPTPCPPSSCDKEESKECKGPVYKIITSKTSPECEPKECAPPQCAYEMSQDDIDKKRSRRLVLGILLAAGALYLLWTFLPSEKPTAPPPQKASKKDKYKRCTQKIPETSDAIPKEIPYLLIGGGTASFAAFRSIKALDATAKILMITNECDFPYLRPPLSKEIWFNEDPEKTQKLIFKQYSGSERSLLYEPVDFFAKCEDILNMENGGLAVARGWSVIKIDPFERIAYLDDGHTIKYHKCLVATGATPKSLEVFDAAPQEIKDKVLLYRGIDDFLELNEAMEEAEAVAVVGGGFLGSELACSLLRKAKTINRNTKIYQIFKEPGNMHKVLPDYLSQWTTKKIVSEGVEVLSSTEIEDVKLLPKESVKLILSNGKEVRVNKVVLAVGVEPNTQLAEASGLEVESECGGFLVNAELEARSHLYAAGDCCCFYDVKLGRRRVEHHDHAVVSGRLAGENMLGARKPYLHQSMFWCEVGPEISFEAIGIVDSTLPTVGVFAKASKKDSPMCAITNMDGVRSETAVESSEAAVSATKPSSSGDDKQQATPTEAPPEEYGKGVIFYLRDEMVVGMVLWNVFNRMNIARQVLLDERKYDDLNEVAKCFNIHDEEP